MGEVNSQIHLLTKEAYYGFHPDIMPQQSLPGKDGERGEGRGIFHFRRLVRDGRSKQRPYRGVQRANPDDCEPSPIKFTPSKS